MQETPRLLLDFMQNHKLLKFEGKKWLQYSPSCGWFLHAKLFSEKIEIDPQQEIPFWDSFPCPLPANLILPISETVLLFISLKINWETCSWKQAPQALPYHSPSDAHHLRGLCSHNSREVLLSC